MEGQTRDASFIRTTRWLQKPTLYLIIFSLCVSVACPYYSDSLALFLFSFSYVWFDCMPVFAFNHIAYVCVRVWIGFCVCWTWFQCTCCLNCDQCSRFSWASIAVNALAPSYVVAIPLNSSSLHIRTYIYVYRASLLKHVNIKQINYRLHSRTWRAQEIRQWRKWFQNPTDFSLCISNRSSNDGHGSSGSSSSNDNTNRDNSKTETFSTLTWVRLYFDIYSHINPLYIYRL